MAIVNLASIMAKVRRLSGRADALQLPDEADPSDPNSVGIKDYINSFYLYDLPSEFRSLKLKDKYTFNTIRGIDIYAFDSENYTTVEMPCYCAKREISLFTDPWSFFGANFNWQYQNNFDTGNGGPGPYSGTTSAHPIIRSFGNNPVTATANVPGVSQGQSYPAGRVQNILITANVSLGNTLNVTDDGNGTLIGDCIAGTIDYNTGAISGLIFTSNVTAGEQIQIQYNPTTMSIPLSIMLFQNSFTLRPVPDRGYTIELTAYRQPTQALTSIAANGGTPELSEWWELLAVGAAKKIYEDQLDSDGIALMDKMLRERYSIVQTRTYAQLGKQRISTIFADQLNYNYGQGGGFAGGSV